MSVHCANAAGAPVDTQFYLAYAHTTQDGGRFAYTAYAPEGPALPRSFTYSTGGKPKVTRLGAGVYQVDLPRLATAGGTAITTTLDDPHTSTCTPVSWHRQGSAEGILATCWRPGGPATDSAFLLTFADHQGLLGVRSLPAAYALASKPTTASSVPGRRRPQLQPLRPPPPHQPQRHRCLPRRLPGPDRDGQRPGPAHSAGRSGRARSPGSRSPRRPRSTCAASTTPARSPTRRSPSSSPARPCPSRCQLREPTPLTPPITDATSATGTRSLTGPFDRRPARYGRGGSLRRRWWR